MGLDRKRLRLVHAALLVERLREHRADARAEQDLAHLLQPLVVVTEIDLRRFRSSGEQFDTGEHEGR